MPFRHPPELVAEALARVGAGQLRAHVAYALGVSPETVGGWVRTLAPELVPAPHSCFRCTRSDALPPDPGAYAQLLGLYLGDGCLSAGARTWALRITCDDAWPGVADEVAEMLARVSGNRVSRARKPGCHDVVACWQHWPCLFPQHGPGKKHERPIVLEQWQQEVVDAHPGRLLRGLFHSDGWRGHNVAVRRTPDGFVTRYRYSRYEFTNKSADIRGLCTDALDLLGVAWRPNGPWRVSVNRRAAVALLDEHVGPKH